MLETQTRLKHRAPLIVAGYYVMVVVAVTVCVIYLVVNKH